MRRVAAAALVTITLGGCVPWGIGNTTAGFFVDNESASPVVIRATFDLGADEFTVPAQATAGINTGYQSSTKKTVEVLDIDCHLLGSIPDADFGNGHVVVIDQRSSVTSVPRPSNFSSDTTPERNQPPKC